MPLCPKWRVLLLASGVIMGCGPAQSSKPVPPASNTRPPRENELNTLILTAEAEGRLGLKMSKVERRALNASRLYGGEVVLPASAMLTVSAPVSGKLQLSKGLKLPEVGAQVSEGQPMLELLPHALSQAEHVALGQARLQLSQARVEAEGQVKQAKVQVEAADITLRRAERLYREKAGTRKDIDDALAQMQLAQKGLDTALQRKQLVDSLQMDTEAGSTRPLLIRAPAKGIVRATFAAAGVLVPSGAPLFEIMNVDSVWIKVPVYVGELAEIAQDKPAQVTGLAGTKNGQSVPARPVPSPPTAQPHASAVDLYYQLPNPDAKYRPGQRVGVLLFLKGEEKSLGLPWSAVVHDIHGGTWVYVATGPQRFVRQRVQVRYVAGDWAVLAEGPAVGTSVVSAGVAELFGSEFSFGSH